MIGSVGADSGEVVPILDVEWVERVDEKLGEAGFADKLYDFLGLRGFEGVVAVPEGVVEVTHRGSEFGKRRVLLGEGAE